MRDCGKFLHYRFIAKMALLILVGFTSAIPAISMQPTVKAMPAINWSLTTTISDGTTLASVLNASSAVAGSFFYTAVSSDGKAVQVTPGTVLPTGDYTITAIFTPRNKTRYHSVITTVPITVSSEVKGGLAIR
jgi:hypothetical protein